MKTLIIFLTIGFTSSLYGQEGLEKGDKVPSFSAVTDNGEIWNLEDETGEQYMVIYFYPAAMTGGCTAQACNYRDMSSELNSVNAKIIGVSGDNVEGLTFFKKAHNLNFTLLSDEEGKIAKIFGVPVRDGGIVKNEFNGQPFELQRGVTTGRWTFIIDKKGEVVYKNEQVNASKDTEEVLSFLKRAW